MGQRGALRTVVLCSSDCHSWLAHYGPIRCSQVRRSWSDSETKGLHLLLCAGWLYLAQVHDVMTNRPFKHYINEWITKQKMDFYTRARTAAVVPIVVNNPCPHARWKRSATVKKTNNNNKKNKKETIKEVGSVYHEEVSEMHPTIITEGVKSCVLTDFVVTGVSQWDAQKTSDMESQLLALQLKKRWEGEGPRCREGGNQRNERRCQPKRKENEKK